ncbi:hypothetical protein L1887_09016 [Cichorium endivia]|nr:hypothetical protein L1887_09016 [Cichorium endivia]
MNLNIFALTFTLSLPFLPAGNGLKLTQYLFQFSLLQSCLSPFLPNFKIQSFDQTKCFTDFFDILRVLCYCCFCCCSNAWVSFGFFRKFRLQF